jgi:ABC-type dipeptide/oligopeptide/nickel transport system ATPase component
MSTAGGHEQTAMGHGALHGAVDATRPLIEVRDLAVSFEKRGSSAKRGDRVRAVDGVRMSIFPGQTLAVVGESGCGKSVTAMSALRLVPSPPARVDGGEILFQTDQGTKDLLKLDERSMRHVRGNEIAMIFQEPMTSLNPVYTVGEQIMEAVLLHQRVSKVEAEEIAVRAMTDVGISDPRGRLSAYPHQFSGGMRQRVMIAMALACQPKLLLADEPTTALDVTIQAQILDLLRELQRSRGMGVMLITHAMGVVAESADVVCVMYAGRVVEYAKVFDLFDRPLHPYTRGLLASIPRTDRTVHRLTSIREIIADEAQFTVLKNDRGESVRPWWPGHAAPVLSNDAGEDGEYVLAEVEPQHWVGLWRTAATAGMRAEMPRINFVAERARA